MKVLLFLDKNIEKITLQSTLQIHSFLLTDNEKDVFQFKIASFKFIESSFQTLVEIFNSFKSIESIT